MTEAELLLFWGKTDKETAANYHPLLFHLLDVGHVTQLMWDEFLSERFKKRLSQALNCEGDLKTARKLIVTLAAVHDIGKATPGFQFQDTPLDWLRDKLRSLSLNVPQGCENKPHNFVSTCELKKLLAGQSWIWKAQPFEAQILSHITGAHHGTFPQSQNYCQWDDKVLGDDGWTQVRLGLLNALIEALRDKEVSFPVSRDWTDLGAIPVLAGLISVADWIGSSRHFEPAGRRDSSNTPRVAQYIPQSRERALKALEEFGWRKPLEVPAPRPDFATFWNFKEGPNPLQKLVAAQTEEVGAPFLMIIEAAMGTGKTEGALWAMDAALSAKVNDGFYFALPTQATSNAMHKRVRDYLQKRLPHQPLIHLQLVHGNAEFSDDLDVVWGGLHPIFEEDEIEDKKPSQTEVPRVAAMEWFTGAKKPLLAPFGVGTIDQSLTAILQTRHWFVRLFGLRGKVVIFDEVHAYDTYMSRLLETLLDWLHELDCSVVLLSATLPSSKRRDLLKAWGASLPEVEVAYPRLTWCPDGTAHSLPIGAQDSGESETAGEVLTPQKQAPQKTVRLCHLKLHQLAGELETALQGGGCAAIVCNTVGEAQALFEELRERLSHLVEPQNFFLFHARMPFSWRQKRERRILKRFGKKDFIQNRFRSRSRRPQRAIVVATQVIEQSLDLDFDWMASFVAPSDLMLQRLGRLHRHDRPAASRYGLMTPTFALLCEADPQDDAPPSFSKSEYVYEREILLRSWLLWRNKTTLQLPGDIESLIEATYEDEPDAPDSWKKALQDARDKAEKNRRDAAQKADKVIINLSNDAENRAESRKDPDELVEAGSLDLKDEDDPNVHASLRAATRDGRPSIVVVCLCLHEGRTYLPNTEGNPDLNQPVDLEHAPSQAHLKDYVKRLHSCSLSLARREIFEQLAAREVPKAWKKVPFLRYARALKFRDNQVQVGGFTLTLNATLGVEIKEPPK